jgi:hypothetical protein
MLDLLAALDIKDLSRSVATRGYETTISAKTHATYNTLVGEIVDELNIKHTTHAGVEDGIPILALTF